MRRPLVTIVMPVFNSGAYLDEALASVEGQTLEDIEIVCVDDGSTDSSPTILTKHASADPRIRIITQPNAGYGRAMNVGIAAATGDYVGAVEPDDKVDDVMFEHLYDAAVSHDADVCKGDFIAFSEQDGELSETYQEAAAAKAIYGKVLDSTRNNALFFVSMMTWQGIYRRRFLEEHHVRHNESPGASFQDNGFWWQVFDGARRVFLVNEAHYRYRFYGESSSVTSPDAAMSIIGEYEFVERFLKEDPKRWELRKPAFCFFYFDNLLARLSHISKAMRPSFAQRMACDLSCWKESGDFDETLFPAFMLEEFDAIEADPTGYDPAEHPSVEEIGWAETTSRHGREETISNSCLPRRLLASWRDCVVEEDPRR
jgi:glycosyltransferase involved in cell wall biosynthesis